VRDEDYQTGKRQHEALQSGLMTDVLFGRNERGGQVFHPAGGQAAGGEGRANCIGCSPARRSAKRRNRERLAKISDSRSPPPRPVGLVLPLGSPCGHGGWPNQPGRLWE